MDVIGKLNDRNLSFPERCISAFSLLKQPQDSNFIFPRKNQYLFDWLTGTLMKLCRSSESPKPEIFLNRRVWDLLKAFSDILLVCGDDAACGGVDNKINRKRSFNFITDDEKFFDFRGCFDPSSFVIKCPILSIFQTCLSLIITREQSVSDCEDWVERETICSVISAFFKQTRVSLPVSFSQITEFIRSLVQAKPGLPSHSYAQILQSALHILGEIVLGGTANYKKTYPMLVKFCIQSASTGSGSEDEIWIEFMKRSLFPLEYMDELLAFLTGPPLLTILQDTSNEKEVKESSFPKSLTFQRALFIDLANEDRAAPSCPLIYESFLRAAGTKIDRQTGFNFFSYLFRRSLVHCQCDSDRFDRLAELISVLQARGNEIYQQRNDQIYRDQSAIIEQILVTALQTDPSVMPFPLLRSLAQLNYYLLSDKLEFIFDRLHSDFVNGALIDFVLGMFELAAMANQLPVLLEIIVKSKASLVSVLSATKLQTALANIFRTKISPSALNQIFVSLSRLAGGEENSSNWPKSLLLLIPLVKSIYRIIDEVEAFDSAAFIRLQNQLLSSKVPSALVLLAEIVRWTPETILLSDQLFIQQIDEAGLDYLNLMLALKCKDPGRVSKLSFPQAVSREINLLLLKYLPVVAVDLERSQLGAFSAWLLREPELCRSALKRIDFFEIRPLQGPFLDQLITLARRDPSAASEYILALPADYISDEVAVELIKCCWDHVKAVKHLLQFSLHSAIRIEALKSLSSSSTNLADLIDFFLVYAEDDDFVGRCVQIEHSDLLIDGCIERIKVSGADVEAKMAFMAKILKYADFANEGLFQCIKNEVDPLRQLQQASPQVITVRFIDNLDVLLDWVAGFDLEFVAACILALPDASVESVFGLEVVVRCQSLRCKFPARTDFKFIEESINLASKLSSSSSSSSYESSVSLTFKKDFLSMIKGLPSENVKEIFDLILFKDQESGWKLSLGLQGLLQLLNMPTQVVTAHRLFTKNLMEIYRRALLLERMPSFLAVLKSMIQVKKSVSWESEDLVAILGVLRRIRQAKPDLFTDIFMTLRFFINFHLRGHKSLVPLLVATICDAFAGVSGVKESMALGRVVYELGSLRRGEVEPYALLPLVYTFSSTPFANQALRKPLLLAMNGVFYHLSVKYQLLQFLSSALIFDHEQRVLLKSLLDEYNKFHKYSGGA